jgi:DNA-binding MarR family transcriptional regulator
MERQLQVVFAEHDLQPGEFDLLATLCRAGAPEGLTAGELAASAMVTSGAITNRLDRLAAKGLVTRDLDPGNRRAIKVLLTQRGQKVLEEALADHVETEERLLASLGRDDRALLAGLLRQLLYSSESRLSAASRSTR